MSEYFTDREEFKNDIIDLLKNVQKKNVVYILSGKTGFGKSAFGQHIINSFKGYYLCIKIKLLIGESISLNEGFYFRAIAQKVSKLGEMYGYCTLSEFFKNSSNPIIQKIFNMKIGKEVSEAVPLLGAISTIYSKNDPTDFFTEYEHLFPDDSHYLYLVLTEYLVQCFCDQQRVILNIENVQDIDRISLLKLKELLKKCDNLFLLLEYTSGDDSLLPAKKFEENFYDSNTEVITKKLKKLNYKSTCDILENMYPEKKELRSEKIRKDIFITIDGNIRQLSDIESFYELSDDGIEENLIFEDHTDYTLSRLKNIKDKNQIMLLCLVISHMGKVDVSVLKALIYSKMYILFLKFDNILKKLGGEQGLLEWNQSQIRVSHDSIIQLSKSILPLKNKITLAYTLWIKYYENLFQLCKKDKTIDKGRIVEKLCYFYSMYPPMASGLQYLFPDIRKIVLSSCNPDVAVSFLSNLSENAQYCEDAELQNSIRYFLLKIYYEAGIYSKAYDLLDNINFTSPKIYILYRAILKNRLQYYSEAIEICEIGIKEYNTDSHFILCAKLIIFISAASNNNYDICETVFSECINEDLYKNYYEYGFLLRNSEIVLPLQDAIPFLEQSAEHFKCLHAPIMEAHSRISLIMNCARIGYFGKSALNLVIAKRLLKHESLKRYVLLNDEVALKMCMGDFNINLQDDLKLAMCTATTVFPKLVINKNLLIVYAKNKHWEKGEEIVDYLLELLQEETNRLNICFTYWNISYFYKQFDQIQYDIYYLEYQKLYENLLSKPIRKSVIEKNVFHKPGNEFAIEFLSYWHFPIPDKL